MVNPQEKPPGRGETPPGEAAPARPSLTQSTDPAANQGTRIGFLVWIVGVSFLLLLMLADLIVGLLWRR